MSTPSIQTLITQAQQVLNLKSTNEIRATLAAVLANANVGTPLNPNLTTQQLWDEFYEIVRQPSDDIMSIVVDQMMRMVFSPPAPGGAGADKQVIFNDMGVLAGDADLIFNKALNKLVANNIETAAGLLVGTSATITGAATVGTTLGVTGNLSAAANSILGTGSKSTDTLLDFSADTGTQRIYLDRGGRNLIFKDVTTNIENYRITGVTGVQTWGVGGSTAMTLNSTGLGIGAGPSSLLYVKKSQNADTTLVVNNENSGAAATARLDLQSNASNYLTLQSFGQSYSGNVCGIAAAKLNAVLDNALPANSSGLLIGTVSTNPLYFVTANAVKMTLDASGNLLVGTVTSPSGTKIGSIAKLGKVSVEGSNSITVTTAATPLARAFDTGGLYFISGYNNVGGSRGWFLVAAGGTTPTVIASDNLTGLTVAFTSPSGVLNMNTTSGSLSVTSISLTNQGV